MTKTNIWVANEIFSQLNFLKTTTNLNQSLYSVLYGLYRSKNTTTLFLNSSFNLKSPKISTYYISFYESSYFWFLKRLSYFNTCKTNQVLSSTNPFFKNLTNQLIIVPNELGFKLQFKNFLTLLLKSAFLTNNNLFNQMNYLGYEKALTNNNYVLNSNKCSFIHLFKDPHLIYRNQPLFNLTFSTLLLELSRTNALSQKKFEYVKLGNFISIFFQNNFKLNPLKIYNLNLTDKQEFVSKRPFNEKIYLEDLITLSKL